MPKARRYSNKRRGRRYNRTKRGGEGTPPHTSTLFPNTSTRQTFDFKPKTVETNTVNTLFTNDTNRDTFDEVGERYAMEEQDIESKKIARAERDRETQDLINSYGQEMPAWGKEDCPDGICTVMGGRKSRRNRRKGRKSRKQHRKH